ncbi:MAG: DoxX family protein [Betaproteobacteria bacterium]|nr:DoxX family protein [Betaproteobacteria bacterium]MBV9362283.1 DoxX family protein [Betaproteobacteria bacterium]
MGLTKDDFRIKAENFDLTKGGNILRIAAGAFMFPHVAGKFAAISTLTLNAGTVGFFAKAGMTPGEVWVYLAATAELTAGLFLVLGLCTRFAALGAAAILGMAVYALQVVKGFQGWTWNTGGYEYPVFWALVCIAIAVEEFKRVAAPAAKKVAAYSAKLAV